jgi:hypothetical protein
MNDELSPPKDWREKRRERRTEERTIKLIERLYRALVLTKADAERAIGQPYGEQAVCVKAIKEFERWDQERKA